MDKGVRIIEVALYLESNVDSNFDYQYSNYFDLPLISEVELLRSHLILNAFIAHYSQWHIRHPSLYFEVNLHVCINLPTV